MTQYIYFVKCPGCDDEPFDFFDEAKAFAMNCLTNKPIITQVECDYNDCGFGERTNTNDLGTVWSWEDVMQDIPTENELTTFSKSETFDCDDDCFDCEFDDIATVLDSIPDNFRKPVSLGEEFDNPVVCHMCKKLFDETECVRRSHHWYCTDCDKHITASKAKKKEEGDTVASLPSVKLKYVDFPVDLTGYHDDKSATPVSFTYEIECKKAIDAIYQLLPEAEAIKLEELDDNAYNKYWSDNFDNLVSKYYSQLLKRFEEDAYEYYVDTHHVEKQPQKTVEALVEMMEENEDTVECKVCEELFDKTTCHKDPNLGWVCEQCGGLVENTNESAPWKQTKVALEYPELTITLQSDTRIVGEYPGHEEWDEWEETVVDFVYEADANDVAEEIWYLMTEQDAADVPGGLEALEDDKAFDSFLTTHLDELVEKYYTELLDIFKEQAIEAATEDYYNNN